MKNLKIFLLIVVFIMSIIGCSNDLFVIDIGKFGYINKSGKIIINPQFDYAYNFEEGFAIVMINQKLGFIDKSGKTAVIGLLVGRVMKKTGGKAKPAVVNESLKKKLG